jgi:hypothetical protein
MQSNASARRPQGKPGTERTNFKLLALPFIVVAVHPENPEAQLKNPEARRAIIHPQTESSGRGVTKRCRLS